MASCAGMKPPESRWQSEHGKVPLNHRPGAGPVPMGRGQDTARRLHLIIVDGIKSIAGRVFL